MDIEQLILEQVATLARKLEDIAGKIEARTERQARQEEQLSASLRSLRESADELKGDLRELRTLIIGDGKVVGLTARVSDLEDEALKASKLASKSEDLSILETQGKWQLKIESAKGKFLIIAAIIAGATGFTGLIIQGIRGLIRLIRGAR